MALSLRGQRPVWHWQQCQYLGSFCHTRGVRSVVALVGERVAAFELGIVCQVFGLDRSDDDLPVYDFAICGRRPREVPTTSGFAVRVTHGLDRVAAADLVTV